MEATGDVSCTFQTSLKKKIDFSFYMNQAFGSCQEKKIKLE